MNDQEYWENRYLGGYDSGLGSHNDIEKEIRLSVLKELNGINSILDVGCGDISLIKDILGIFPEAEYTGLDISEVIIDRNRKYNLPKCKFEKLERPFFDYKADLVLCFDVLYHITDEEDYIKTLESLKRAFKKYLAVITYNDQGLKWHSASHIVKRKFKPEIFGQYNEIPISSEGYNKSLYLIKK